MVRQTWESRARASMHHGFGPENDTTRSSFATFDDQPESRLRTSPLRWSFRALVVAGVAALVANNVVLASSDAAAAALAP